MRIFACLVAIAWLIPTASFGQVELADPDAPSPGKKSQPPVPLEDGLGEPDAPGSTETVEDDPTDGDLVAPSTKKATAPVGKLSPNGKELPKEPQKAAPPPKREPPSMVVKTISDAELNAVWLRWRQANDSRKVDAEQAARKELLAMRSLVGSRNMELWAVGLLRAAQAREAAGESGAAVEIAVSASELAPELPATWFLLTRLYFTSDPSGVPRYVGSVQKGLAAQLTDSRYLRPLIADLVSIALIAFIATTVVVMLVLLLRRGYCFLYDFHFFFPREAARWQTSALALLLLCVPIGFRVGLAPTLLAFFAAITLYLTVRERVLAVVLIGSLGLLPLIGGFVVERTAFAQTVAEDLYLIERGGQGIEPLVQRYEKLAAEDKVGFPERFVLGHFHLNRGHLAQAINQLKLALALRPEDAPCKIALAKALFLRGDLENSRSFLEEVKASSPNAVALLDLSRVYQRRVQVYGESNAGEVDKANQNLMEARQLDPSLPSIQAEAPLVKELIGNDWLRTLPLAQTELVSLAGSEVAARRVRSQLSQLLVGGVPQAVAPVYPALVALLLLAFGSLGKSLDASRVCNRCGRPVSRRADPEVSAFSPMCTQCVNVFAKKNVGEPSVRARKQLEVARYESRLESASTILGVLWSGMGHVFSGAPVRGAIYGYLFVLAITGVLLRAGVVRPPFESLPVGLRLVPLVVLFLVVYPVSLLRLRQNRS